MNVDFTEKYRHKIKAPSELLDLVGAFPRQKRTILCHGVFDVVHPGHIRHLAYAKTKADILIVSITSDLHIKKGIYRPYIPEELRALNLAAFEMVDYVLIDNQETPLETLTELKPDFFCQRFRIHFYGIKSGDKGRNGYSRRLWWTNDFYTW
jgi:cytidyltransferase-like protein